jgi:hypothetical protein
VIVDFLGSDHNRGEPQISRKKTVFLSICEMFWRLVFRGFQKPSFDLIEPLLDNDFRRPIFRPLKLPSSRLLDVSIFGRSSPASSVESARNGA